MRLHAGLHRAALAAVLLALVPAAPPGAASSSGNDPFRDTGERTVTPIGRRELRVLLDEATGRKAFEDATGRRYAGLEDAFREEEDALPPVRRTVHPDLWPLLDDPSRGSEPVRVVLLLRSQPLHEASVEARARTGPLLRVRLDRMRALIGDAAPFRDADPGRVLQLGHRLEEEARILSPETRAELRRLRGEVQDLVGEMRREVLATAAPLAALAQAPVVERIQRIPGAKVLGRYVVLDAVAAEVPARSLAALAADLPSVARILPHGTRTPGLDVSVPTLGAATWYGAGYDGSSTTKVAVMDTGIDSTHPALSAVIASGDKAVFLAVGQTDPGFADNASSTDDYYGHGTHVGGIVMSQDATYKGVAPGGALMNAKCGYNSSGGGALQDGDIMSAGDWAATHGAGAVNASFGGGGYTDGSSALSLFFDALSDDLNIAAAVAAGNSGPSSGTVGTPGDAFNVLTVGSLNDKNTTTQSDNAISSFSSRGPLNDGRRKPDLCAPGENITSCSATWEGSNPDFVTFSGTSMATPHIAGCCALLLDYAASWRPEGLKALLLSTTRNTSPYATTPDNTWGWGATDLGAAFTSRATVREGTLSSSGASFSFVRMPALTAGQRSTLCWNRQVTSNGANAPVTYHSPLDLDLYVYDESDDSLHGSSTGALNTVEQVPITGSVSFPLLKVKRASNFPSGQSAEDFAVASEGTGSSLAATPPSLSCTVGLGQDPAKPGDTFTVTVTVADGGDLPAWGPSVTLALPVGYAIGSGANPQSISPVAAGGTRQATWTVIAGGTSSGVKAIGATATCVSYGETFTSPQGTSNQVFDAVGPTGTIVVQGGATAVMSPDVTVAVFAADDETGVAQMRARNAGTTWGPWQPFASSFPWTLASGDGLRTVEVQLQDGVGNLSGVLSDSIFLDTTPPTGSFVLSGDALYLMPWEVLTADTTSADGTGSGVTGFRWRWSSGAPWATWADLSGGDLVALPRPAAEQAVTAEGEFRDSAGNVSASSTDGIHLVEARPPSLTAARSYAGALAPGGDIDSFVLGAVAGDSFTIKIKSKSTAPGADFQVDADLFDPSGAKVATGRFPQDGKKPGIARFHATLSGDHRIVLRPVGADAAAGGSYTLTVKYAIAKQNHGKKSGGDPLGGFVDFPFDGVENTLVTGVVRGLVGGDLEILRPDGTSGFVPTRPGPGGVHNIPGLVLVGGSGNYILRVPASGPLSLELHYKPPRRGRMIEVGD
jgi:hypothetical protein